MPRLIVVDACLTPRIASVLRKRGRRSQSTKDLGFEGETKDPALLPGLAQRLEGAPWVLYTDDDAMPRDHGEVLREHGITVATVNSKRPADEADRQEEWRWEIAMRWAHVMAEQEETTWRRYSPTYHRPWRPRIR